MRLWQGAAEPARAIALYLLPEGGLRLVHGDIDLSTEADFARPGETVSLRYRACARGRGDIADFNNHDRPNRTRLRAGLAHAARLDEALPRDPRFLSVCHVAAVAEFGLAPTDLPALGSGAILPTVQGPMPVEPVRPGGCRWAGSSAARVCASAGLRRSGCGHPISVLGRMSASPRRPA